MCYNTYFLLSGNYILKWLYHANVWYLSLYQMSIKVPSARCMALTRCCFSYGSSACEMSKGVLPFLFSTYNLIDYSLLTFCKFICFLFFFLNIILFLHFTSSSYSFILLIQITSKKGCVKRSITFL